MTDIVNGIGKSEEEHQKRSDFYGTNAKRAIKLKSLWDLIAEQFEDTILQILLVAAAVSLGIGIWKDGIASGWVEGVTIYLAVVIIVAVTAGNDYVKQKQFQKLMSVSEDNSIPVIRNGIMENTSIYDLLVGDIF